jgi:hypothetical protein
MAYAVGVGTAPCDCWFPMRYTPCDDFRQPNRWWRWSKTRCRICGHSEDCHTKRILKDLKSLVDTPFGGLGESNMMWFMKKYFKEIQ